MHRAERQRRRWPAWLVGLIIAIVVFAVALVVANLLGVGDEPTIGAIAIAINPR